MRTCSWSRSFLLFSVLAFFSASAFAESPECLVSFNSARLNVCDGQVSLVNANLSHLADMQAFADSGIRVVKFDGPITAPQRRALASLDVEILGYAPFYGYKVRMDARLDDTVRGIPGVNWTGPYLPVWKVGINLTNELLDGRILDQADDLDSLRVSLHPGVGADQARGAIESVPGTTIRLSGEDFDHEFFVLGFERASLASIVDAIATNEVVNSISFHWPAEFMNSQGIGLHQSGVASPPDVPVFDQGLYGCGQTIGILDSGLHTTHCSFDDPGVTFPFENCGSGDGCTSIPATDDHRKIAAYYKWSGVAGGPGDDHNGGGASRGHGTFVSGNALGSNIANPANCANPTSPGNMEDVDGMAPGARVVMQEAGASLQYLNNLGGSLYHAATTAYENGARIHNNSWGSGCRGLFGCVAGCIVEYRPHSRGGDMAAWENPDLLILAAAGNSGGGDGGPGCGPGADVGSPGNAKSVLGIGGTQRGTLGDDMYVSSSRGPASDRRTKPDILAQSTGLFSSTKTACGTDSWAGTSFGSPTAAGLSALVREYLQRGFYPQGIEDSGSAIPNPSGALIRAIMTNGSAEMTGTGVSGDYPDQNQGWGRILLDNALYFDGDDRKLWLHDGAAGLDTGDVDSHVVVALDGQPLAVTLVWHDFPAEINADPHIVNVLRLEVEDPNGQVWTQKLPPGGGLTNPNPFQGTSLDDYDDRNTVHQILFDAPVSGTYQVRVRGIQVAMGDAQPYALAITGDLGGFSIDPPSAEVCAAEGSTDFTLTLSAQFEGTTNLSVTGEPAGTSGSFSVNPVVFPDDESVYTLSGLAGANGGDYTLEFTATDSVDPGNTATVGAGLALYEDTADAITLLTPADQTTNTDLRPEFTWNVADASEYLLQVATDSGFTNIVIGETLSGTSFTPGFDLATGTDFFWRVRGNNACGEGDWSAVFEFQTRFEPIADISPASFSFTVQTGTTESQPLFIENTGTGELAWQIGTDEITGDCTSPAPVPWLSGDPASGSTPPGPPAEPDIIVDGNLLTHGQHEANLCVTTNTTSGPQLVVIPVFVNAIDPNIAFLEGNVTSLGLCDADGGPLEGALVSVQGQDNLFEAFTDAAGFYSFEISDSESPVEMTVSAELHATEVRPNVVLTGGQLNIEDFDLDGDSACIEVAPDQISVTLELNQSDSDTLEIFNVGTQTLDWEILFNETTALSAARNDLLISGALLIPDSSNDRVLAFDPETGDLLDENFVPPQTETLGTIQHMLLHPDNERLLLSTQTQHVVWSFDLEGNLLGPFSPPGGADTTLMQNLRGMDYHPDTGHLLVTVSAGGNADSIVEVELDGNVLGTFIDPGAGGLSNPWDLEFRADDVLVVGVISGGIWRFDHSGAPLGTWGPPLSFPRQIVVLESGNVLVTNSSGTGTTGVYEFDADGNQLAYYDVAGAARGVYELGNGNLLVSNADGVHEIDRNNNLVETKFTVGSHHLISFAKFSCDEATLSWVSASPGSGSIGAGDPAASVSVDFDAGGLVPGVYTGELCVDSNDPVNPRVQVPVSMEVVLPGDFATLEGTVQTAGFCGAGELAPLQGATVEATSAMDTYVASTDGNGFYQLFLPESESPVDITVTAPDHLEEAITGVTFTAGDVVVNDFDLAGDSACIDVNPEAVSATVEIGQIVDETIDISNVGTQTLDWSIDTSAARGTSGPLIGFNFISASGTSADPQNWTRISDPDGFLENVPDDTGEATEVNFQWGAVSGSGPLYVTSSTLAANAVPQYDYDLSGMVGYGFRGSTRFFIELSGLQPGTPHEYWLVAYRSTSAIDQTVQVSDGDDTNAIEFVQAITSGANGGRFIVNDVTADDTMHWNNLAFETTSSSAGTIRIEWEGDSQSTVIGAFAVRPLLACDQPGWLSLNPVSGSVGAGDPPETVTATLDASGLALGEYQALVCIESNDPTMPEVLVPVDLVVEAGADHGTIEGEVLSQGHCSDNPFAIFDAQVEVTGQSGTFSTTTDANGFYQIAVPASEGPVDMLVTAPGHHDDEATGVEITGGEVVTVDFSLVLDEPCIEVDPPTFNFEVLQDGSAGDLLTISNLGAADLDWSIAMTAPPGVDCANPTNIDWLSVDPASGTAEPGSASETDVLVDADGLAPGNYVAVLCVSSNDPETGLVQVPVGLTVIQENPVADISPDFFEFELEADGTAVDTLNIGNIGAGDLVWNIHTAETGTSATVRSEAALSVLVREGDPIPGYGTVVSVFDISVNNERDWLAEVSYTPTGGGTAQRLLLKNGQPLIAAGEPVPPLPSVVSTPAGTSTVLKALNNHGSTAFRLSLSDGPASAGMYHDLMPFVLQGDISAAPQLSPDTPYAGFFRARLDDSGRLLLVATVNDSELPGSSNRVLMWFEPDGAGGWNENVQAVQQVALPGMSGDEVVGQIGSNYYSFRIDHGGNALYAVNIGNAASDVNGALYYNDTMVIRKGDPSPLAGSNYGNIGDSTRADMNSQGDLAFRVDLTGLPSSENTAIVLGHVSSGEPEVLFIRQSEVAPGTDDTIASFGSGASVKIDDAGEVLWYANLTGDADTNQALFVDDQVLVRKGVTHVDGDLITTVAGITTAGTGGGISRGFTASDNGRYVLMRAMLEGGDRAAVLVDREATPGCDLPSDVPWLNVTPASGTTAPGDTDEVEVLIDTAGMTEGDYEALLCVTTNDPANALVEVPVNLTVLEIDPPELVVDPDALDFGELLVGSSGTLSFTVSNAADAGAASVLLDALILSGAGFEISGGDCEPGVTELAPGDSCMVEVSLTPNAPGLYSGSVTVEGGGQTATVTLSGTGIDLDPGVLELSPSELAFGDVAVDSTAAGELTLTNTGVDTAAVLVSSMLLTSNPAGAFADTGNGSCEAGVTELEPGASCTIGVAFAPAAEGSYSGSVIVDGSDGKKATASLSGSGIALGPEIFSDRFEQEQ